MRNRFFLAAAAALIFGGLVAPTAIARPGTVAQDAAGGAAVRTAQAPAGAQGAQAPGRGGDQGAEGRGGRGGQGRGGGGRGGGRGRGAQPDQPPPRSPEGRVLLNGMTSKDRGLWLPGIGITTPIAPVAEIPFQPWARALYADRQAHELEPHARCKASGVTRPFQTPYGVEFVELPEIDRIYIFDVGGPHTYRTIYMDGRSHPPNLTPSYYGHSIGWWEGDTLVIDSTGFNENFWLDRRGAPHSEQLRTIERLTRTGLNTINYQVTIHDPEVYTQPWTGGFNLRWDPGNELFEYICQQANYADELMIGSYDEAGFHSLVVP